MHDSPTYLYNIQIEGHSNKKKKTPGLLMVLEERKERIRLRNLSFMNPRGNYVKTMAF